MVQFFARQTRPYPPNYKILRETSEEKRLLCENYVPTKCTLLLTNLFKFIYISSTCFEQIIVHHHEVCTNSLQYFNLHVYE